MSEHANLARKGERHGEKTEVDFFCSRRAVGCDF